MDEIYVCFTSAENDRNNVFIGVFVTNVLSTVHKFTFDEENDQLKAVQTELPPATIFARLLPDQQTILAGAFFFFVYKTSSFVLCIVCSRQSTDLKVHKRWSDHFGCRFAG